MKAKQINRIAAEIISQCKAEKPWTSLDSKSEIKSYANSKRFPQIKGHIDQVRDQILAIAHLRHKRQVEARKPAFIRRSKEQMLARYIEPLKRKLETIYPLHQYSGKWAGGSNHFAVRHHQSLTPIFEVSSHRVWSDNGKWSGLDGYFTLTINVFKQNFDLIGGLLTITSKADTGRAKPCFWLKQTRGYDAALVEGFLIKGFHQPKTARVDTIEKATALVNKQRSQSARCMWQQRQSTAQKRLAKAEMMKLIQSVWITEQDSIAAGNCPAGTQAFRQRYQDKNNYGTIGAVRADELINQANGNLHYVTRIIRTKTGISI